MLTVILKILSILGILLLVLLGVLLSAILLVLFVPVTYRVRADRQEAVPEGNPDGAGGLITSPFLHIAVKADWLLGVLRVRFQYPDPGAVTVKLLCFTLFDSGTGQERTKTRTSAAKQQKTPEQKKTAEQAQKAAEQTIITEQTETSGPKEKQTEAEGRQAAGPQCSDGANREEQNGFDGKNCQKQSLIEKIRYTFQRLYAKIKELRDHFAYYKEVLLCEDTRGLVHHALMRLGRILKSIRPRRLRADIRFGTGSPDTTGYAFGIYGMFCSWLGKQVILTPDFERAVFTGELDAAGHIAVFKLLWHGLMLITDRRLRELVDKLRKT